MELLNQLNQAASAIAISAALVIFIVANITPGPNNLMLMVSGVRIGLRRTLPHIWGILVGVFLLVIGLGLVLDTAADFFPPILLILRFIFSAILLWLAYKIATAPTSEEEDSSFPHSLRLLAGFAVPVGQFKSLGSAYLYHRLLWVRKPDDGDFRSLGDCSAWHAHSTRWYLQLDALRKSACAAGYANQNAHGFSTA